MTRSQRHKTNALATPRAATDNVFIQEGDYWTIAYNQSLFRIRDARGLQHLARLLGQPYQRIPALALIGPANVVPHSGARSIPPGADEPSERARSAVTKAIRAAIRRIGARHAGLGYHLNTAVKTGHECVYMPDPEQNVSWVAGQ